MINQELLKTMETANKLRNIVGKQQQSIATFSEPILQEMRSIQAAVQPTLEAMNPLVVDMVETWREMLRPIQDAIELINTQYGDSIAKLIQKIRPMKAVDIMRNNQYVYWQPLHNELVDAIIGADDVDDVLLKFEIENNEAKVEDTIRSCIDSKLLGENKRMFCQATDAYRRGDCDLSIVALFSILDGLLTKSSGSIKTNMRVRMERILEKMDSDAMLESDECSILILGMTFCSTIESLSESIPFSDDEPQKLNRHWIVHGRSTREIKPIDCIKLINCIYGVILIERLSSEQFQLDNKENTEHSAEN